MIKIGNIDYTPYDKHIYIYGENVYNPKVGIVMPDDFRQHNELMSEYYIQFSFNYNMKLDIVRTDYVDYQARRRDYQCGNSKYERRIDHINMG
jgi:hypothetical protein